MEEGNQSAEPSPAKLVPRKPIRRFFTDKYSGMVEAATEQPPPAVPTFLGSIRSNPAAVKPTSPISWERLICEVKDDTPKRRKHCNCRNSKCLKLYCECFRARTYCNGCNCCGCLNSSENEAARNEAINLLLVRKPSAFSPKIANTPHAIKDGREEAGEPVLVGKHNKGCHCKKSGCLKNYCECFQAKVFCSESCKCLDCKNFEENDERKALIQGDHGNNFSHMHPSANVTLNGSSQSSSYESSLHPRKRVRPDLISDCPTKGNSVRRLEPYLQASHVTLVSSSASIPVTCPVNSAPVESSKLTYRPVLAGIIKFEDVKELCKHLIIASAEEAKKKSKGNVVDKEILTGRENQIRSSIASSNLDGEEKEKEDVRIDLADNRSNGTLADKPSNDVSGPETADAENERRPLSPQTQALMCEEDIFTEPPDTAPSLRFPCNEGAAEAHVDLERAVLIPFRDFLHRLVLRGSINEAQYASTAETSNSLNVAFNGLFRAQVSPASDGSQPANTTPPPLSSISHACPATNPISAPVPSPPVVNGTVNGTPPPLENFLPQKDGPLSR